MIRQSVDAENCAGTNVRQFLRSGTKITILLFSPIQFFNPFLRHSGFFCNFDGIDIRIDEAVERYR
jgi:hypothetical protein